MIDLETLALLAAAINSQLRPALDKADFRPRHHDLIDALQDGKSAESRKAVAKWLGTLGVSWNAKNGGIGSAIIEAQRMAGQRQRALTMLATAQWKLRCPSLGSPAWADEQLRLATAIEQVMQQGSKDAGNSANEGPSD